MTARRLEVAVESWPIAGEFVIARGAKREATVVVATVADGHASGRGECVPYARYGQTPEGTRDALLGLADAVGRGLGRAELGALLPAGAARNALDCALWDFEAKSAATSVARLAGLPPPRPLRTAFTLGVAAPEAMAEAARAADRHRLLKLKLAGAGDAERLMAVRAARPEARLIVDANEAWPEADVEGLLAACALAGVELVEQPLPAGADALLARVDRPVPVCADESLHTRADLAGLRDRYDAVNVKLDKTGGLTEALALVAEARGLGFRIMVGCMVATSLAMAPAMLLARDAEFVDLDGPLLLARDRRPGLRYEGDLAHPPLPELWG